MTDPRIDNRKARRRARRGRKRGILAALSSAAMALLGGPGSSIADGPVEQISAAYSFSFYAEDSLSSSKLAFGDKDRYEIESTDVVCLSGQFRGVEIFGHAQTLGTLTRKDISSS